MPHNANTIQSPQEASEIVVCDVVCLVQLMSPSCRWRVSYGSPQRWSNRGRRLLHPPPPTTCCWLHSKKRYTATNGTFCVVLIIIPIGDYSNVGARGSQKIQQISTKDNTITKVEDMLKKITVTYQEGKSALHMKATLTRSGKLQFGNNSNTLWYSLFCTAVFSVCDRFFVWNMLTCSP